MYTSPSPLPRRAPLRLPFSVHIRKLFFLFSQLRSLHHPPLIPHLSHRRSGHAPRRGRRPRQPASFFFHAYGGDISRSGATSFCPRRQKDAKTPPKTHGLWNSFTPNVIRRKKAHKESPPLLSPLPLLSPPPLLSPLPLPRTARVACYDRLRDSAIRAAAASIFRAAVPYCVGAGVPDGPLLVPFMSLAGIFRAPARHPFARGGKRMQKRRQRPMAFGIPLRRT